MPHKVIMRIFAASAFLATVLRFAQLFFTIEASTGFSVSGYYEKVNIILYGVIFLLIAIPAFFSAVSSNRQPTRAPVPKSFPLLTICNFLVAVCILATVGFKYIELKSLTSLSIIELIFSIVSAIWFIVYGISGIVKIKLPTGLSITPVALYLFKLVNTFISHNGLANISENLLEILFLCCLLLFFLLQSKIICKITIRKSSRMIFPIALITFMLMLIGNLPPLIINLLGKGELLHSSSALNLEYVLFGTYAFIFTMQLYTKTKWPPSIHTHSTEKMENSAADPTTKTKFIMNPNENI